MPVFSYLVKESFCIYILRRKTGRTKAQQDYEETASIYKRMF